MQEDERKEEPLDKAIPFGIPKRVVWEAYQRVKANRGAAGVDDQSIEDFDQDVKNNLFKLWNRLSSGSYFPPPVKRVAIKKLQGGSRPLGIPTWLAQQGDYFIVMMVDRQLSKASGDVSG